MKRIFLLALLGIASCAHESPQREVKDWITVTDQSGRAVCEVHIPSGKVNFYRSPEEAVYEMMKINLMASQTCQNIVNGEKQACELKYGKKKKGDKKNDVSKDSKPSGEKRGEEKPSEDRGHPGDSKDPGKPGSEG